MKIGILTSSIAGNIGGIMQNYALQQVLKSMGHQPVTIDHYTPYSRIRWAASRVKQWADGRHGRVPFPWYGRIGSRRVLRFAFAHIDRTRPVTMVDARLVEQCRLDAIVVGSDQVWRLEYNDIPTMFLDFLGQSAIKRVAYAASFGVERWDYPDELTAQCRRLASRFDAISVREAGDVALCSAYLGATATHVTDPTLLLDRSAYARLCAGIPPSPTPTLFAYILDLTPDKRRQAEQLARHMGLSLRLMSAESNLQRRDSVEGWLAGLRDATFVLTDSYHGTLLAVLHNKDFATLNNVRRGQSRFKSILGQLGLTDRLVAGDIGPTDTALGPIDWPRVNICLKPLVDNSLRFLRHAI